MKRLAPLALVALLAACGGSGAQEVDVTVELPDKNGSGIFGTAELTRIGDASVRVVVALEGALPDTPLPAYVVLGGCSSFEPEVVRELKPVIGGKSITEVDLPIADITTGSYALAVGSKEPAKYAACGDMVP